MLDKRTLSLLKIIDSETVSGGYKVFSFSDLVSAMPSYFDVDESGIRDLLKDLYDKEYLSVKYEDDKEVCLSPLPKGRLVFENIIDEEIEKSRSARKYFFYSFMGAASGGASIFIIFLIAYLVFGVK